MTAALAATFAAFQLAEFGLGGGADKALSVASRRCDFDRRQGVALFEGAVRVDYGADCTMCADRLFVFVEGTNDVDRIDAEGSVTVTNGARVGSCASAAFARRSGMVEMRGREGSGPARLSEPGASEVSGRRIRFWLEAGQVEIDGAEILVNKGGRSVKDL